MVVAVAEESRGDGNTQSIELPIVLNAAEAVAPDSGRIVVTTGRMQVDAAFLSKARIAAGSGEKMRKVGAKGAPTAADFRKSAKTRKK